MDERERMIKERLLDDLIQKMTEAGGSRLKPKGLEVEVAAPDKDKLAQGLDKAKSALGSLPEPGEEEGDPSQDPSESSHDLPEASHSDEDDEHRLLQLLEDEDEEDGRPGRR